MKNQALFPACVLKNAELKFNFGEEEFKFPPKDGFVALSKAADGYVVKSQHTGIAPERVAISGMGYWRKLQ